jgi:hypothetical protein
MWTGFSWLGIVEGCVERPSRLGVSSWDMARDRHPAVKWVPGVKRQGPEAHHSPPTTAEAKKTCTCASTAPHVFTAQRVARHGAALPSAEPQLPRRQTLDLKIVWKRGGTTVTDQNQIQEQMKRRLNSRDACYHSICLLIYSTLWPESASELYRPSDRRLSVKLVPTLAARCATWSA